MRRVSVRVRVRVGVRVRPSVLMLLGCEPFFMGSCEACTTVQNLYTTN